MAWALQRSPHVRELFLAPGNGGTAACGRNLPLAADDLAGLADFAARERIDLTVVGPEAPLAAGVVNEFLAHGLRIFGPT